MTEKDIIADKQMGACKHLWDSGVRTEGVRGGYVFTCALCGVSKTGYRSYNPSNKPLTKVRKSKKERRNERHVK